MNGDDYDGFSDWDESMPRLTLCEVLVAVAIFVVVLVCAPSAMVWARELTAIVLGWLQ